MTVEEQLAAATQGVTRLSTKKNDPVFASFSSQWSHDVRCRIANASALKKAAQLDCLLRSIGSSDSVIGPLLLWCHLQSNHRVFRR